MSSVLCRPRQTKTKKDSKLELFGFEDADVLQDQNSGDGTDGRSSYKIRYFGFDDMSDSDGGDGADGGGDCFKERRRRRAKMSDVPTETPVVNVEDTLADDPPDPFERPERQERPTVKESKKNSERQESRTRAGDGMEDTNDVVARPVFS